jgi:hypothetical protein
MHKTYMLLNVKKKLNIVFHKIKSIICRKKVTTVFKCCQWFCKTGHFPGLVQALLCKKGGGVKQLYNINMHWSLTTEVYWQIINEIVNWNFKIIQIKYETLYITKEEVKKNSKIWYKNITKEASFTKSLTTLENSGNFFSANYAFDFMKNNI